MAPLSEANEIIQIVVFVLLPEMQRVVLIRLLALPNLHLLRMMMILSMIPLVVFVGHPPGHFPPREESMYILIRKIS